MTKNEAVQVNQIYLIFKSLLFSGQQWNKLFNESPEEKNSEKDVVPNDLPKFESHITPQLVDEVFGEFYLHYYSNDPQEDEFRRRMQRKKRKSRRKI